MIKGNPNTERAYRNVLLDSYSSLKDFADDKKKYYKRYVEGQKVEEEENKAMTMGSLVETLLWERDLFDKKFKMSECEKTSTGIMLNFVTALVKCTIDSIDPETNQVSKDFEELSREAHELSGFKISYEAVIKKFAGSDDEIYFNELLEVTVNNLIVVGVKEVTNAERIVDELKNNSVTSEIINRISSERWETINQLQIERFEIDGYTLKGMLDYLEIDHLNKVVYPYDLKCTWAVERFFEDGYLYRRYYIQAYVYYTAVKHYIASREDLKGYRVEYMRFIVCDSINYFNPLIYCVTDELMDDAYWGFTHRGRKYVGVGEIIKGLKFAQEMNVWNISMENYLSKGVVELGYE